MTRSSYKPLPLKQRTSSVDGRRDYSSETYTSLVGLVKLREFFITVDHFSIWKRHLAWAMENGKDLREYMTQRYASSMVFMSLLLSTELSVLFNSAYVTTQVRQSLAKEEHQKVEFWVGILIIISAVLTLLSLISSFTAWAMVSAVSEKNAHCVFRSSVGQYVAELPGRFIVCSIYTFLLWLMLFFFLLLPFGFWSISLAVFVAGLFVHTITAFSAFGRIIMHSGAMGSKPIFDSHYESSLLPNTLHNNLLKKAKATLSNRTSIRRQYQSNALPINRNFSQEELSGHLVDTTAVFEHGSNSSVGSSDPTIIMPTRRRTASLVKFSDGFDTNGDRFSLGSDSNRSNMNGASTPTSDQSTPNDKEITVQLQRNAPYSANGFAESPFTRPKLAPRVVSDKLGTISLSEPSGPFRTPDSSSSSSMRKSQDAAVAMWLQSSSSLGSLQDSDLLSESNEQTPTVSNTCLMNQKDTPELQRNQLSFPPLPKPSRSHSAVSSLAVEDDDYQHLSPDERFDREYGDLFDPPDEEIDPSDRFQNGRTEPGSMILPLNLDQRPNVSSIDPTDTEADWGSTGEERRGLLDRVEAGDYSSFRDQSSKEIDRRP